MHHQPGVARTARSEKTGEAHLLARSQHLRRQRRISDHNSGELAAHFPFQSRLNQAGFVRNPEFLDRHIGGGSTQRTDFGQHSIENQ